VYRVSPGSSNVTEGPWNLAHLYEADIISAPEVFYCASGGQYSEKWSHEYYSRSGSWPSTPGGSGDDNVRTGYNYYPQSASNFESSRGGRQGLPLPAYNSEDLNVKMAMATDLMHSIDVLPHQDPNENYGGLHAMFGDGHVKFQSQRNNPQAFHDKYWGRGTLGNDRDTWRLVMSLWQP
jgi:hypothetical protein